MKNKNHTQPEVGDKIIVDYAVNGDNWYGIPGGEYFVVAFDPKWEDDGKHYPIMSRKSGVFPFWVPIEGHTGIHPDKFYNAARRIVKNGKDSGKHKVGPGKTRATRGPKVLP